MGNQENLLRCTESLEDIPSSKTFRQGLELKSAFHSAGNSRRLIYLGCVADYGNLSGASVDYDWSCTSITLIRFHGKQ